MGSMDFQFSAIDSATAVVIETLAFGLLAHYWLGWQ